MTFQKVSIPYNGTAFSISQFPVIHDLLQDQSALSSSTDPAVIVKGVCLKKRDHNWLKFYPYVRGISAFFLLATVFVYTYYPTGERRNGDLRLSLKDREICFLFQFP